SFVWKFSSQITTECCGCAEQFSAAQFCVIHSVDHGCSEGSALQTAHAVFGKMSIQRWPTAETEFAQFEQRLAHGRDVRCFCLEWSSKGDRNRVPDSLWEFPEKFPALERKDRSPKLIEPDRNDLGLRVPRNDFITALQTQQRPSAFQLAFREHTHDFAFGDFFRGGANCGMGLALADGDATNLAQDGLEDWFVIVFLVDDVAD